AQHNLPLLDDLVIVTNPDDQERWDVCRRHSIHHVFSDDHIRGGPFNKARLIQRGLNQIGAHDWVLHLDADIVLPRRFRDLVEWAHLDERHIYGADRCSMMGWDAWCKQKQAGGGTITDTRTTWPSKGRLAPAGPRGSTATCRSDSSNSSTARR